MGRIGDDQVIYHGIKAVHTHQGVELFITDVSTYRPVEGDLLRVFHSDGFLAGVNHYRKSRIQQKIDRVNDLMRRESSGNNNYKRIKMFRLMRARLIKKYSEI